jgi:hypothetical protein
MLGPGPEDDGKLENDPIIDDPEPDYSELEPSISEE